MVVDTQLHALVRCEIYLYIYIYLSIYHHKPNQSSKGLETIKPTFLPQTHEQSRKKQSGPIPNFTMASMGRIEIRGFSSI
jgi:hypothetical protein